MAETKCTPPVALEAGNSQKMVFEPYRELVMEAEAKEWLALAPVKGETAQIT